jgi:hypothetical protein
MSLFVSPTDFDAALPTVSEPRLAEAIADAEAMATFYAPGLKAPSFQADGERMAQAKAIIRAAVIYQCEPANDGDRPRSPTILAPTQVDALRALSRTAVPVAGVYTVSLGMDL